MIYESKKIKLKNGTAAVLRSPTVADAAALLDYLRITAEETDFLLRYPEECVMTAAQEEVYLRKSLEDRIRLEQHRVHHSGEFLGRAWL